MEKGNTKRQWRREGRRKGGGSGDKRREGKGGVLFRKIQGLLCCEDNLGTRSRLMETDSSSPPGIYSKVGS